MLSRGYDEDAKAQPYFTRPIPTKDILTGVLAGLILVALLVQLCVCMEGLVTQLDLIELSKVNYVYPDGTQALTDIDLSVRTARGWLF